MHGAQCSRSAGVRQRLPMSERGPSLFPHRAPSPPPSLVLLPLPPPPVRADRACALRPLCFIPHVPSAPHALYALLSLPLQFSPLPLPAPGPRRPCTRTRTAYNAGIASLSHEARAGLASFLCSHFPIRTARVPPPRPPWRAPRPSPALSRHTGPRTVCYS